MKKLVYVFILLVFNACVDMGSSKIEYTIFNETPVQVSVLGFVRDYENPENGLKADPIIIQADDKFSVTRITGIDSDTHMRFYSLKEGGVDSVRVVFNNEKVQVFGGIDDDTPHDIFTGGDDRKTYITQEDYESAIPCSPCD